VDNTKLSPANIVILAAGVLILIGSFFGFYKFDIPKSTFGNLTIGGSKSFNAWSTGQFLIATLPALLGIVMAAHVALAAFAPNVSLPDRVLGLTWDQIHLALGFQAALMMVAFLIRSKPYTGFGVGFWLMLIAGIALLVGAIMRVTGAGSTAPGTSTPDTAI
jgi:hypothetical protein